ncbi:MAG: ABC-F family ATP-binding cassette domain-containing protein [Ardenticatenaceae bacterium]|nr:ABC-F family ATP-binding cassette domain-containing protein [Ardenticatenaceae bacterium]
MSVLSFHQLTQSFGAFDLFQGVTGSVPNDGRIGLVGPNGVGKTTLLQILAGIEPPTTGDVHLARRTRLGYLRQEAMEAFQGRERTTVHDEMRRVFAHLQEEAAELRDMENRMAAGDHSEELLHTYSQAQMRFEAAGGYDYELRIQQVLDGLGFDRENWETPLDHLSGGQRTRALLARLLLEEPDLLVLDEPTNHLDIEAVEWLEGRLNIWEGAVLIVSHDRYFLDKVVNMIWELSADGLEVYRGNYSAYTTQRVERWERRRKELAAEQARLEKEMDYIRRNIASQRTSQAKGKLKRLNATLGVDGKAFKLWRTEEKLKEFKSQRVSADAKTFRLNLGTAGRSGHIVLRTDDVVVGYPGQVLFKADDIELTRLECAALIGPNGSGKTTFLKTILGDLPPLDGAVAPGASLQIGYFSQAHDALNLDNTILDELLRHQEMPISEARSYLGQYLFSGDDVQKKVSTLSGGERGRLALAILALQQANFLLLDEPTNHLDIASQELLQSVLERFEGTILMVSHDRYLIDRLATQIWSLGNGRLEVFGGSYQEYVTAREAEKARQKEAAVLQKPQSRSSAPQNGDGGLSKNEQRRLAEAIQLIETQIEAAEARLAAVGVELQAASEAQDFAAVQTKSEEFSQLEGELETLMTQWEALFEE